MNVEVEVRLACPKCKAIPGMPCLEQMESDDPKGTKRWVAADETHPSRVKRYNDLLQGRLV